MVVHLMKKLTVSLSHLRWQCHFSHQQWFFVDLAKRKIWRYLITTETMPFLELHFLQVQLGSDWGKGAPFRPCDVECSTWWDFRVDSPISNYCDLVGCKQILCHCSMLWDNWINLHECIACYLDFMNVSLHQNRDLIWEAAEPPIEGAVARVKKRVCKWQVDVCLCIYIYMDMSIEQILWSK